MIDYKLELEQLQLILTQLIVMDALSESPILGFTQVT